MTRKQKLSIEQSRASDPELNVWVQANAGTGKTSVLVRRLLRILFRSVSLSDSSAVLCLTYTNAGASEMRNRILAALREWACADDSSLREILIGIAHAGAPSDEDLAQARAIFYNYIDNPDILKIKTIHGFCEEILRRFPMEAGIAPAWSLVSDADQRRLLYDAFQKLVNSDAATPPGFARHPFASEGDSGIAEAFAHIVGRVSEHSLDDLLAILTSQYKQFFQIINYYNYRKQFIDTIIHFLELDQPGQPEALPQNLQKIIEFAEIEINSSKKPAIYLINIVNLTKQYIDKSIQFSEYKKAYLTATGGKIANVAKKDYLAAEQDRVYLVSQREANQQIFDDTLALFDLSAAFAQCYKELKTARNLLDFDDLILYVRRLFSNPENMGWVLSQLDLSLSHILVDEAQDTSPEQWDIMKALSFDFFTGGDAAGNPRSLFVVGDTKQSIYGFQGADPNAFAASRVDIGAQIKNNLRAITEIPLAQSFRSAAPILAAVDFFFDRLPGFANHGHKVFRSDAPGRVELRGLIKKDEQNPSLRDAAREYIKAVADKIESQIAEGAAPGDIMVLVQRRMPFAAPLVNELKKRGISVAGSDRIVLPEFPAIRDLLNLTRWCVDPSDDYSLACALKSPLFRFSEKELHEVCAPRGGREAGGLFCSLRSFRPSVHSELAEISEWSRTLAPYSFFMRTLNTGGRRQKMIAALGAQIAEPLEEFLTICLSYERTQSGTLRHFLKWFIEGGSEIKRELSAADGVRVATTHGSKGLEAPIVFLIDTIRTPRDRPEKVVEIPNSRGFRGGESFWLWSPRAANSDRWSLAADAGMSAKIEEYWRLLYVAMTRARDRLYIYGFCANKNPPADSWHARLWEALQTMPGAKAGSETIIVE